MTSLTIYDERGNVRQRIQQDDEIAQYLDSHGVLFEQWITLAPEAQDCDGLVFETYRAEIDRICQRGHYQSVDVINVDDETNNVEDLRAQFLAEHCHHDDEVRFFVRGEGLFYLHISQQVIEVHCEAGDLLAMPALTPHWFDMGPEPDFAAIRFFTDPSGWKAHYTGSDIVDHFPCLTLA